MEDKKSNSKKSRKSSKPTKSKTTETKAKQVGGMEVLEKSNKISAKKKIKSVLDSFTSSELRSMSHSKSNSQSGRLRKLEIKPPAEVSANEVKDRKGTVISSPRQPILRQVVEGSSPFAQRQGDVKKQSADGVDKFKLRSPSPVGRYNEQSLGEATTHKEEISRQLKRMSKVVGRNVTHTLTVQQHEATAKKEKSDSEKKQKKQKDKSSKKGPKN